MFTPPRSLSPATASTDDDVATDAADTDAGIATDADSETETEAERHLREALEENAAIPGLTRLQLLPTLSNR